MASEILLKSLTDPDFGALELIETRTFAAVGDGPWEPLIYRHWSGKAGAGRSYTLMLDARDREDAPNVDERMRACFRMTMAGLDAVRRRVGASELELAREWAASGDLDIELDADKLADLLRLGDVHLSGDRLTLYFQEDADIFAGHIVEVRIDAAGQITEICLAG